jgi:hypothetical protein
MSDLPADVAAALARLWRDEGAVEPAGDDTDFFDAGGDSMGAALLAGAMADAFAAAIDVAEIYRHPTFAAQVALVISRTAGGEVVATPSDGRCPATPGQVGLFFREMLESAGESVAVSRFVRSRDGFDDALVARALVGLVERHASLRTVLSPQRGGLVLQVEPVPGDGSALVERLDGVFDMPGNHAAANPFRYRAARFDLKSAPLIRATVAALRDGSEILQLAVHHVAADGGSASVLVREFASIYRGLCDGTPTALPTARPYLGFARQQRDLLADGAFDAGAAEIAAALERHVAGHPAAIDFGPGDAAAGPATANLVVPLDLDGYGGNGHGGLAFAPILGALATAIARRAGRDEVLCGVAAALRRSTADVPLVGMYVNLVPVCMSLSVPAGGEGSNRALRETADSALAGALRRADVPFELAMKRVGFRQPHAFYPFDFLLTEMRYPDRLEPGLEPVNVPAVRRVDMFCPSMIVRRCGERVDLVVEYAPRRMDLALLEAVVEDARAILAAGRNLD